MTFDCRNEETNLKREIKDQIFSISDKPDMLINDREIIGLMTLSEKSLKEFLEDEPDLYSVSDLKVV
ncbi:MAG: hypothetical protein JXQ82_10110 [Methanomicrobiaceae archaeon]|nr:hypothetical protein [Methanomicrobiaceae archaeon]